MEKFEVAKFLYKFDFWLRLWIYLCWLGQALVFQRVKWGKLQLTSNGRYFLHNQTM